MAIYARLENGAYAEVTGVYKTDGTEVTEIFQGERLVYSASNEIYGTVPLYYNGKGYDLTDYLISGNTIQDGTPSPEVPVDVVGCGVRTGNLWDEAYSGISGSLKYVAILVGNFDVTMSTTCPLSAGNATIFLLSGNVTSGASTINNGVSITRPRTISPSDGYITVAYRLHGGITPADYDTMLNTGSTALPYEPYGYKLPLTVNGTEYPSYFGQVETTRRIKKLVLTGEEIGVNKRTSPENSYSIPILRNGWPASTVGYGISSHFTRNGTAANLISGEFYVGTTAFSFRPDDCTDTVAFRAWLAAQYAAGTPVTVWYVLAEPETAVVNEPLMKIGDYADTISFAQAGVTIPTVNGANVLDMASPVKPSEVYIKGKGIKPTGYGQLTDVNGVNILGKDSRPIYVHGQ